MGKETQRRVRGAMGLDTSKVSSMDVSLSSNKPQYFLLLTWNLKRKRARDSGGPSQAEALTASVLSPPVLPREAPGESSALCSPRPPGILPSAGALSLLLWLTSVLRVTQHLLRSAFSAKNSQLELIIIYVQLRPLIDGISVLLKAMP